MALTLKLNIADAEQVAGALEAIVALEGAPEARTKIVELAGWTRSTEPDFVVNIVRIAAYIRTVVRAG